jgi:hypothetical protein
VSAPCVEVEDDGVRDVQHCWESTGLDVIVGVLCTTRRCVWCGLEQLSPYGGRGSWRDRR